jgi:hypothetical protein
LRDVHGFRGKWFGFDAEQAREVFSEDQIQLIGLLPINETSDPD